MANDVRTLPSGVYLLEPSTSAITLQQYSPSLSTLVNREFCMRLGLNSATPPAVAMLIFADVTALALRYTDGVLGAALLDCGMLMYALQLAATEVGLRSCMVGCAMNAQLSPLLPIATDVVTNLGGVAIGG